MFCPRVRAGVVAPTCVFVSFSSFSFLLCVRARRSHRETGSTLRAAAAAGSMGSAARVGDCTHTHTPTCLDDQVLEKVCLSLLIILTR